MQLDTETVTDGTGAELSVYECLPRGSMGLLGLSESVNLGVSWIGKAWLNEIAEWKDLVLRMGESKTGGGV